MLLQMASGAASCWLFWLSALGRLRLNVLLASLGLGSSGGYGIVIRLICNGAVLTSVGSLLAFCHLSGFFKPTNGGNVIRKSDLHHLGIGWAMGCRFFMLIIQTLYIRLVTTTARENNKYWTMKGRLRAFDGIRCVINSMNHTIESMTEVHSDIFSLINGGK